MKKTLAVILALLLAAMLAACAGSNDGPAATEEPAATDAPGADGEKDLLGRIQERGAIVIGTEGTWEPWTYHDEKGELTGLDIEIGRRIAEHIGVEAQFAEAEWSGLLDGVKAGRFDIVCNGVGYTPTRAENYSFSEPYVYSTKYLIVRADDEEIKSLDDISGRSCANSPSSTYAMLAEEYGATVVYTDAFQDCVQQLEQGRVDLTINSKGSFDSYMAEHPEANIKVAAVLPGDPVAFPMDNTDDTATLVAAVNETLAQMREDGSLSELSLRFLGEDRTSETPAE